MNLIQQPRAAGAGNGALIRSRGAEIVSITDTMVSPVALDTTLLVTEENIFGFRSLCATMNLAQYLAIEIGLKREKDIRDA